MEISTNIKDRILKIADYKIIRRDAFIESLNQKYSNYRGKSKLSSPSADVFVEISTKYSDINIEWLLTGKGRMLKEEDHDDNEKASINSIIRNRQGIPLIPTDAMAGHGAGSMQIMDYETSYYEVPEFTELRAEFMIRVKGSSMYPKYSSGDLLACKKVSLGTFFQWNKVYVLDTEQGPLVKRVKPSSKEEYITLVSDNPNYDPFDINLEEIHSIACVLGVIRLE